MSGVAGIYVDKFTEASHALPHGMHMNSDYPFMLPPIVCIDGDCVVLKGKDGDGVFKIRKEKGGREYCVIDQISSYERLFNKKPTRFKAYPFKDDHTPAAGNGKA